MGNVASRTISAKLLPADPQTREAEERAISLGFVPNALLGSLPMNCTGDVLPGWKPMEEESAQFPLAGGRISPSYQKWLRDQAEDLARRFPPSPEDFARVELLRTQVRYRGIVEFRLDSDDTTNERLVVALELHSPPEKRVEAHLLGSSLIAYERRFHEVLTNRRPTRFWSGCDMDRLAALGEMLGYSPVDRTKTWSVGLKLKILHPIPAFDPDFAMSLEDCFRARCTDLLLRHNRLHILWSGGVDSTAVLVAFLRVASPKDWASRLSVHYDSHSLVENPEFFERFVKPLPLHMALEGHVRDFIDGSRTVVTGDPADMLFGTIRMADAFAGRMVTVTRRSCYIGQEKSVRVRNPIHFALEEPWQKTVPKMLRIRGLLAPGAEAKRLWLAWAEPQAAKAPIPIVSLFDWLWWITYSCKFQFDLTRLFYNRSKLSPELMESVVSFYDWPAWHQWSFHNHDAKMQDKTVWASYKQPLKAWILSFDGNMDYYKGKTKVQSSRSPWGYQLAIDDKLNIIHFGWLSVSRMRLREKYGDDLDRYLDRSMLGVV
mmetsp:Transcript_45650/g.108698  ORF Transcript_45650/g.108698 Transcript_45650/m.108698 type:complete len:546 (+) Transcript_45650:75-1712(+)